MNGGAFLAVLMGTAIGDSMGLPAENMSARKIAKRWKGIWNQSFVLGRGMVSDDTEHTVFVAQAFLESRGAEDELDDFQRRLAWKLRWWLLCVPAGIGFATLRAVVRLWLGWPRRKSGVFSAGNGPAMRSAIIGVYFARQEELVRSYVRASTRLTHTDPKAETTALAVALTAAWCVKSQTRSDRLNQESVQELLRSWASAGDGDADWQGLVAKIEQGYLKGLTVEEFALELGLGRGVSGYAYHTVPVALFAWLRHFGDFRSGLEAVLNRGGDTDTLGAITAALLAINSEIPADWAEGLFDFPISKNYLNRLADAFQGEAQPTFYWVALPLRNVAFFWLVICHVVMRFFL